MGEGDWIEQLLSVPQLVPSEVQDLQGEVPRLGRDSCSRVKLKKYHQTEAYRESLARTGVDTESFSKRSSKPE